MEVFVARQPIFNFNKRLHAYELLYRGNYRNNFTADNVTGERATSSLLSTTFLTEGIDKIGSFKPCYINFTEELLVKKIPLAFPKTKLIIEILEDVTPTSEVIAACTEFKEKGYTLALDDFVFKQKLTPMIRLADIIKIDFRVTPADQVHKTLHSLSQFKLKFLAEKLKHIRSSKQP